MGEFIRGWKRKLGIVTLVLAGLVMTAWMHSCREFDWFGVILFPSAWRCTVISGDGGFVVVIGTLRRFRAISRSTMELTFTHRGFYELHPDFEKRSNPMPFLKRHPGWSVNVNRESRNEGAKDEPISLIPFWVIVHPLILLSAWLLLSKNVPQLSKKPVDLNNRARSCSGSDAFSTLRKEV